MQPSEKSDANAMRMTIRLIQYMGFLEKKEERRTRHCSRNPHYGAKGTAQGRRPFRGAAQALPLDTRTVAGSGSWFSLKHLDARASFRIVHAITMQTAARFDHFLKVMVGRGSDGAPSRQGEFIRIGIGMPAKSPLLLLQGESRRWQTSGPSPFQVRAARTCSLPHGGQRIPIVANERAQIISSARCAHLKTAFRVAGISVRKTKFAHTS